MFVSEFLTLLLVVSVMVSLTVEALKKMLGGNKFPSNIMAGIVSIVLSTLIGIFYCTLLDIPFTSSIIIYLVSLVFLSWLCAMLGYDKVVQAIKQIKK